MKKIVDYIKNNDIIIKSNIQKIFDLNDIELKYFHYNFYRLLSNSDFFDDLDSYIDFFKNDNLDHIKSFLFSLDIEEDIIKKIIIKSPLILDSRILPYCIF